MNILGCLDRPTSGRYWINGREMSNASANQRAAVRNSTIGFVFQNFNLLPRTSALENVVMPLEYSHASMSEGRKHALELLTRLGLAERTRNEPSQLSGGQQQRVAIARSLINRPSVLLADEPTGALDSRTGEETLQLFRQLNREEGITIVLVTHDAHVAGHADRTIHIRDGLIEDADDTSLAAVGTGGGHRG
jgi:ABC-type lipoprotein export system ATPase subunit